MLYHETFYFFMFVTRECDLNCIPHRFVLLFYEMKDPMDAFLGLYDNAADDSDLDDWIEADLGLGAGTADPLLAGRQQNLPPEPQSGNVEYKLKLVNPTEQRIQHLVTQVHSPSSKSEKFNVLEGAPNFAALSLFLFEDQRALGH